MASKSNISYLYHQNLELSGVCKRPIAVESGPQGKMLVLDYDFESREIRVVELRLHQPVDVHIRKETFKDAKDLCFTNGIAFVSELGSGATWKAKYV